MFIRYETVAPISCRKRRVFIELAAVKLPAWNKHNDLVTHSNPKPFQSCLAKSVVTSQSLPKGRAQGIH